MHKFHISPVNALVPFIDRLWGWESLPGETVSLPDVLPGIGAELYFHYRKPFLRMAEYKSPLICDPAHLFCIRRQPVPLCSAIDVGFIAVRFRAGMVHRFTDMPGREFIDRILAIDDMWGVAGRTLALRVSDACSMLERVLLIQAFLIQQLRGEPADSMVERAISLLYGEGHSIFIEQLAIRMGIGRRQMERRFIAVAGQSPAEVRRLVRFQKVVRSLLLDPSVAPLDVALAHGYYDQSHFTRDFRELSLAPPNRFLREARAKTHFYNTPRSVLNKMPLPVTQI